MKEGMRVKSRSLPMKDKKRAVFSEHKRTGRTGFEKSAQGENKVEKLQDSVE